MRKTIQNEKIGFCTLILIIALSFSFQFGASSCNSDDSNDNGSVTNSNDNTNSDSNDNSSSSLTSYLSTPTSIAAIRQSSKWMSLESWICNTYADKTELFCKNYHQDVLNDDQLDSLKNRRQFVLDCIDYLEELKDVPDFDRLPFVNQLSHDLNEAVNCDELSAVQL